MLNFECWILRTDCGLGQIIELMLAELCSRRICFVYRCCPYDIGTGKTSASSRVRL